MEVEEVPNHRGHEDKKRKMKTPLQLETLERVFAEEKYPSEAVRARLSIQLGLSNRQLKMWFCHRRLKERKHKEEDEEHASSDRSPQRGRDLVNMHPSPPHRVSVPAFPMKKEEQVSSGSYQSPDESAWKFRRRQEASMEKDLDSLKRKKSRQTTLLNGPDPRRMAELQAIASVEAQLGEPLRWDSPCLGVEFDPLPAGAFSSPGSSHHRKSLTSQDNRHKLENKSSTKSDVKLQRDPFYSEHSHKSSRSKKLVSPESGHGPNPRPGSRMLQEYQFIPERPTGRDGMTSGHEKSINPKALFSNDSARSGLSLQGPFLRGNENMPNTFGLDGKPINVTSGLMLQREMYNNPMLPLSQIVHQEASSNFPYEAQFGPYNNLYHMMPGGVPFHAPEKAPVYSEEEPIHGSRKRKSEEIRLAKELEAHRKRLQRELEREEISRRKREEQLQKEIEKERERMLREKQREEERIQREKQREDERLQREARREMERQERLVQKEAQRLEREREKEEARRIKEATRLKAAIERAHARRLAREYVELIDDERLELLEAAAVSQGLPSIYLLDGETLQGLDRYKDSLKRFPPAAVKMKHPIATCPWIDSQQNLGNIFMVWKFLIAFADVLGLWPFTLDEFVQAFHDHDPRLLAEIHMALIRTIVRDIEDVAKASACGGAVNQYTAPSTIGGGHSQLVEAAFAWGFDYREWSRYLSPLTWPEILRQFSLAAGYGPIWKQHQSDICNGHACDDNKGENMSRMGPTANNAGVLAKGKGGNNSRKQPRLKLTPGTVKYAAFHVLSVEGAGGLSISEIAERVERYGLRDLSTSKTPESSIAAALSRDTTFFERVAPSTYCVKPTFRKNPEDAERLLQAALEKTRLFQSGNTELYDVEKEMEDTDDDGDGQDSEDESESVEVDYGNTNKGRTAGNPKSHDGRSKHASLSTLVSANESAEGLDMSEKTIGSPIDSEIDESHAGEPWVQGLMEGEYSDLSVEERLNALVALVEAVNEGNTIRVALEERMEAATALKRQMWAEAQLDKRRSKEEQVSKPQSQTNDVVKGDDTSVVGAGDGDPTTCTHVSNEPSKNSPPHEKEHGVAGNADHNTGTPGFTSEKTRAQLKVDIDFRADELYVFRSLPLGLDRRHNRYWQFVTSYIAEDPGCGRIYFESSEDGHWEVINTEEAFTALMANLDTRGIREAHLHGVLQKLEGLIRQGMKRHECVHKPAGNGSSTGYISEDGSSGNGSVLLVDGDISRARGAIQIQNSNIQAERRSVVERYKEFDKWIWSKQAPEFSDLFAIKLKKNKGSELLTQCQNCHDLYWPHEKHCQYCHETFEVSAKTDAKYTQHVNECEKRYTNEGPAAKVQGPVKLLPSRLQLLKSQLLAVEVAVPGDAFKTSWTESQRKEWASQLKHATSPSDLLVLLTELEDAVRRDWLLSSFETTKELLEVASIDNVDGSSVLPWIPRTTSAIALRLMAFDSALFYSKERKDQNNKSSSKNQRTPTPKKTPNVVNEDPSSSPEERNNGNRSNTKNSELSNISSKQGRNKSSKSATKVESQYVSLKKDSKSSPGSHNGDPRSSTDQFDDDFRSNNNQSNGTMHYEDEDTSSGEEEDDELIIEDEYEDEDAASEEHNSGSQGINIGREAETDSMDGNDDTNDNDVNDYNNDNADTEESESESDEDDDEPPHAANPQQHNLANDEDSDGRDYDTSDSQSLDESE